MVLFIFGFWLTVDLILGDINILRMLGVTPLVRQVRHLVEGFDAEQVPTTSLEYAAKILTFPFLLQMMEKTEEVLAAINNFQQQDFSHLSPSL